MESHGQVHVLHRVVGRPENPGVPVLFGGHNLFPLVEIRLTDLSKSGGAMAPPAPPGTTGLLHCGRSTFPPTIFLLPNSPRNEKLYYQLCESHRRHLEDPEKETIELQFWSQVPKSDWIYNNPQLTQDVWLFNDYNHAMWNGKSNYPVVYLGPLPTLNSEIKW